MATGAFLPCIERLTIKKTDLQNTCYSTDWAWHSSVVNSPFRPRPRTAWFIWSVFGGWRRSCSSGWNVSFLKDGRWSKPCAIAVPNFSDPVLKIHFRIDCMNSILELFESGFRLSTLTTSLYKLLISDSISSRFAASFPLATFIARNLVSLVEIWQWRSSIVLFFSSVFISTFEVLHSYSSTPSTR